MKRVPFLIAGLLASATVLAQTAAPPPAQGDARQRWHDFAEQKFTDADSNHDGNISQSEWQSARLRDAKEMFARIDTNRDGKLTRAEMEQARSQHMGRGEHMRDARARARSLDTNGDQQLSRAEIGDQMPRLAADFDRLDTNKDGKLSRDEIVAGRGQRDDDGDAR